MVFWKTPQRARVPPSTASAGMDHSEEVLAEVDEPPDERRESGALPPLRATESYLKTRTPQSLYQRRESLLTRQLHSETEHSDDEHLPRPPRTLSTQSTWSTQSAASTAELTSDDGRSMPSPAISPPLPPTEYNALPIHEKPLDRRVQIVGHEEAAPASKQVGSEKSVEATLGRKRCIMFACRGKDEAKPKASPALAPPSTTEQPATSPPKRKCTIKFACPSRATAETKPAAPLNSKRTMSPPPPPQRRSSGLKVDSVKQHRGSDSTVTHASPKSIRKSPSITTTAPTPTTETPRPSSTRKLSSDSDDVVSEATRFHEFASSEDEPEEWTKESSCHRHRLTVNDTLQKESVIRKACEEVEEEVLEEEDEEEAEEDEEALDEERDDEVDEEDDDEDDEEEDESEHSDVGFHSDDEDGFAASDSEGEDSDYEWWKPGGSTAATSIEHLDHVQARLKPDPSILASSVNSMSSGQHSPRSFKRRPLRRRSGHAKSHAIPIGARLQDEDDELPDSTDFVCGTLDEDRPLEQAYINRMQRLEAAKHRTRPQDIDPTFPTSDPEMDEEDDEDLVDPEDSDGENRVHGEMDDEEDMGPGSTLRRRSSPRPRKHSNAHRSPPPAARYHSPPPSKRVSKHHSPPPPSKHAMARSPPPKKLFGSSPKRARSPAPGARMTSPPNTRSSSPSAATHFMKTSKVLAERPQLTHTASLPRGGGLLLSRMCKNESDDDGAATVIGPNDVPKRGAIDIVKGLEKKRQRRREKVWQKMCAKAAAKGEKAYKVKPGKGCERMREVGLQLQEYQGKAKHILSL